MHMGVSFLVDPLNGDVPFCFPLKPSKKDQPIEFVLKKGSPQNEWGRLSFLRNKKTGPKTPKGDRSHALLPETELPPPSLTSKKNRSPPDISVLSDLSDLSDPNPRLPQCARLPPREAPRPNSSLVSGAARFRPPKRPSAASRGVRLAPSAASGGQGPQRNPKMAGVRPGCSHSLQLFLLFH